MRKTTFKGANVFMSRNLVPPEIFDSLHDVLKDNGAEIILCCDPSRNGPNDYHIISSRDHEKFNDLRQKGCNLLGPQCVFSCAKEHRVLPKQGFTCCLAMDGVKILASGFEMETKVEINKLVTAMGGLLQTKASSDINFVIVKNVLAAKYKWALNTLKKPIVSENWLNQCWKEHRVVPHESYRVLPFSGLTISVTQVPLDERKEIEKLVSLNGGKYSAELTRKSTHLVCDAPEGDKYKVAKRWGHIHIVTRVWFNQSVARRACLNEESYPVQTQKTSLKAQRSQDKGIIGNSQGGASVSLTHQDISCDADLEATLSQNMASTFSDVLSEDKTPPPPTNHLKSSIDIDGCVAEDSQSEDNDLYLLDCKIHLVGFDASEMRRLVNIVRRGGGSRYMALNEQLTHIVVGNPSESEKKEVRSVSAMGVINVVKTVWLEDCAREKKEIPVARRYVAYDLLLPKDSISFNKGSLSAIPGLKQENHSIVQPSLSNEKSQSLEKGQQKVQHVIMNEKQDDKSGVFSGRSFRFSTTFPDVQRGEIVDWIHEGGGKVADTWTEKNVNYTVESHGVLCSKTQFNGVTNVTSHWIRSCLQSGNLLDVNSHILFSPLQCKVPLPGFIGLQFCVSQYEEKDKELLRNLCHVLGGKLVKRLSKKVNYLICKFTEGPKFEAARDWGIQTATMEWIWECVKQNKVVGFDRFLPREATVSEREAGMCTMSQYPTQATRMVSSQLPSQTQDTKTDDGQGHDSRGNSKRKEVKLKSSVMGSKKLKLPEDGSLKGKLSSGLGHLDKVSEIGGDVSKSVPTHGNVSKSVPTHGDVSKSVPTHGDVSKSVPTHGDVSKSVPTHGDVSKSVPTHVDVSKYGDVSKSVPTHGDISKSVPTYEDISKSIPTYGDISKSVPTHGDISKSVPIHGNISKSVPDVAAAIEDLLEQTSKIHDQKTPERSDNNTSEVFKSDHDLHSEDPSSAFGLYKHWTRSSRSNEKDDINPKVEETTGIYGGFSETQTESQVVGYEEDLSGRQMIIDRVRTRSGLTPNTSLPL